MAPWDGSGNFGLSDTVTANTDATADEINAILTDLANGINNALAKDGQNPLTNPLKLPSGTAVNPSLTFAADLDIGFFRKGANQIGIAIGGSEVGYIDSDGLHITFAGTFSNAAIAALAALTPAADKLAYFDDVDSAALADFTAAARTLLAAADAAGQRTAMGLAALALKATIDSANLIDTAVKKVINPFGLQLLHIREEQNSGTNGSTVAGNGSFTKYTINTVAVNEITDASVSSSVISLPAGTYFMDGVASAARDASDANFKVRLRNTTDSSTALVGGTGRCNSNNDSIPIRGRFTLAATKNLEIQIYGNSGGGSAPAAVNSGEKEVYLDVLIWKIA